MNRRLLSSLSVLAFANAIAINPGVAPAESTTAPTTRPIEAAWNDLAEPEPRASIALLRLSDSPDEFVALATQRLLPLTLTQRDLATLLVELGSEDDATWRAASDRLRYVDPRLAESLGALMERLADDDQTRARLVEVMSERDAGSLAGRFVRLWTSDDGKTMNFADGHGSWWAESDVARLNESPWLRGKSSWTRAVRAIALLEHVGTPAARAIVDAMATGHPDAQPTRVARALIAARPRH